MNTIKLVEIAMAIKGILTRDKEAVSKAKGSWREIGPLLNEAKAELPSKKAYGKWCDEQGFSVGRQALHKYRKAAAVFDVYHNIHQLPADYNTLATFHGMAPALQQEILARWDKGECLLCMEFKAEYVKATPKRGAAHAAKLAQEAEEARLSLPRKYQAQLAKIIAKKEAALLADFQVQVKAKLDELVAPEKEKYERMWQENFDAKFRYEKLIKDFTTVMTYEEFNLVRNCLHPDRPERSAEKLTQAFAIFKRLESTVDKRMPIHKLRERGWAHVSPFYKKTPRT